MTRSLLRLDRLFTGLLVGLGMAMVSPSRAGGSDVYVVRFLTDITYTSSTECYRVGWRDHLLFRNTTNQELTVRAVSASNGHPPPTDLLTVPARRNRSLLVARRFGENGGSNNWARSAPYVFIVNRLDVPAGILVESRGELWGPIASPLPCPISTSDSPEVFGAIPMPVVRELTPAGAERIHLATDLGTQRIRTNVGLFNAGSAAATAIVEVRRSCDDTLIEARTVNVPAQSVVQVTGINDNPRPTGCTLPSTTEYSRYVAVAMDQPGFSFVTTLANDLPTRIAVTASSAN